MARGYWLLKTDPETFGLQNLKKSPKKTTLWDGVRNYQARNFLRDAVRLGDGVLLYHSRVTPQAIVARATVVRSGYPDPTQFDPKSPGYDAKASREAPRWYAIDVRLEDELVPPVTLDQIRRTNGLAGMSLLKRGNRLSVQPVTPREWRIIRGLRGDPVR